MSAVPCGELGPQRRVPFPPFFPRLPFTPFQSDQSERGPAWHPATLTLLGARGTPCRRLQRAAPLSDGLLHHPEAWHLPAVILGVQGGMRSAQSRRYRCNPCGGFLVGDEVVC